MGNKSKNVYELLETHLDIDRGSVWQYTVKLSDGRLINLAPDEFNKMRQVNTVNRDNNKIIEKSLEDEYNLRNKLTLFSEERFIVHNGDELKKYIADELVNISGYRRDFETVYGFISTKDEDRVVLVNGIRRTGKTIIMYQSIQKLVDDSKCNYDDILLVTVNSDDLNSVDFFKFIDGDMDLRNKRYKYVFVDEISRITGLNSHGQYLHDLYHINTKFILTGTHSYTFPMLYMSELATRSRIVDIKPVSYEEYTRLVEDCSVMEYIRFGGIFTKEFLSEAGDKNTGFVWTAISRNIAGSISRNGVDRDMLLKGMDIVQIDTVINRIIFNSLSNTQMSLFTSELNPKLSLGEYGKLIKGLKKAVLYELEKQLNISGKLQRDDNHVVEYTQRVLTDIGLIDWVLQYDNPFNKAYQYTRFIGLLYSICGLIVSEDLIRRLLPDTVEDDKIKFISSESRASLEGIVLETFIVTELNSYFNKWFNSRRGVAIYKLRYNKQVEVDIVVRNKYSDDPLKSPLFIEVKRENYYRSSYARWLVDKSIYVHSGIRMIVYNGPSCKVNPRNDIKLMQIKKEDSKQTTSNAKSKSIPMGFDERCGYIYLLNVEEILKNIGRYVDEDFLITLPEYSFEEGHVGELIQYSAETEALLNNMNLNFND